MSCWHSALLCMVAPLSIIQVHTQAHDDIVLVTVRDKHDIIMALRMCLDDAERL
jgi:hypothetical protein